MRKNTVDKVGSIRCYCCNKELQDWEDVYCDECIGASVDSDLEELYKEYKDTEKGYI